LEAEMLARRVFSCSMQLGRRFALPNRLSMALAVRLVRTDVTALQSNKSQWPNKEAVRRRMQSFRISMSDEVKAKKLKEIERLKAEQKPQGLFAKFKFYFKRYWYISIPVHCVCSVLWFGTMFLVVKSGVDVIGLLEKLHMPDAVINKVKNVPPSAGVIVVALILYKIVTPLRYATTLAGIRVTFGLLRKFGMLRTAKEVEYQMRSGLEELNKRRLSSASQLNARPKPVVKRKSPVSKSK